MAAALNFYLAFDLMATTIEQLQLGMLNIIRR